MTGWLDAMKMKIMLHAPRDGIVAENIGRHGKQVDTEDLLRQLANAVASFGPGRQSVGVFSAAIPRLTRRVDLAAPTQVSEMILTP
jgi:hypothetical protein